MKYKTKEKVRFVFWVMTAVLWMADIRTELKFIFGTSNVRTMWEPYEQPSGWSALLLVWGIAGFVYCCNRVAEILKVGEA